MHIFKVSVDESTKNLCDWNTTQQILATNFDAINKTIRLIDKSQNNLTLFENIISKIYFEAHFQSSDFLSLNFENTSKIFEIHVEKIDVIE